jgi:hypothetical protein
MFLHVDQYFITHFFYFIGAGVAPLWHMMLNAGKPASQNP